MTVAAYWWAAKKRAAGGTPPDIASPGDQTYYENEVINLVVWNNGGPATTWTAGPFPEGIYANTYSDRIEIKGAHGVPDIVAVSNQNYYIGQTIDLYVYNGAGAAESWQADQLPNGLSITEQHNGWMRIQGTAAT